MTLVTAVCCQWHTVIQLLCFNYKFKRWKDEICCFSQTYRGIHLGEMANTRIDLVTADNLAAYLAHINLELSTHTNRSFQSVVCDNISKHYARKIPLV
jgi:hypothetical protein